MPPLLPIPPQRASFQRGSLCPSTLEALTSEEDEIPSQTLKSLLCGSSPFCSLQSHPNTQSFTPSINSSAFPKNGLVCTCLPTSAPHCVKPKSLPPPSPILGNLPGSPISPLKLSFLFSGCPLLPQWPSLLSVWLTSASYTPWPLKLTYRRHFPHQCHRNRPFS